MQLDSAEYEAAPGIHVLPVRTPTLPPATHTNSYLVGHGVQLLIEPASGEAEELRRTVEWLARHREAGGRLAALVLTHHHADHIGGAARLRDLLGVPLWAHEATARRLGSGVVVDRFLEAGDQLDLPGDPSMSLEVLHTPGHAPGHLCFLDSVSGAMIAGDMVAGVGTILVEPVDGDMQLYLESLAYMASRAPRLLLPAHGPVIDEPRRLLDYYIRHRHEREARILEALRAQAGPATAEALVPLAYDDVPREAWTLAERSTCAHLIKLAREGRVRRQGERWSTL